MRPRSALVVFLLLGLAAGATAQPVGDAIGVRLAALHEARQFSGSVLAAEGDRIVYEGGVGEADRSWHVPNGPDTRFRIASVTKQFTAALVLQLWEEGLLDLDAPLTRALPGYPAAQGDRVTVHQLLSHTSGIPEHVGAEGFDAVMRDPVAPADFLALFSDRPLDFEPGSAYRYSNSGYVILGVLIERLTGQSYAEALQTRLLAPLGLTDTGYDDGATVIEHAASGYTDGPNGVQHAPYLDPSVPYAAGMLSSTVRDLFRWTRALHRGEPFQNDATLTRMLTPVLNNYAYGIGVSTLPLGDEAVQMIGHSGGIPGFSSFLLYLPASERTVAVIDNTSRSTQPVALDVARLLSGVAPDAVQQPIGRVLDAVLVADGIDAAEARYREIRASGAPGYDLGEDELNALGYALLARGETEAAIRILALNVEAYPEAWNPHDSLGEAYLAAGDSERAIASYQRALALNPAAESARDALQRLGAEASTDAVTVPAAALASYVGRYALRPGLELVVTRDGDRLFAQPPGQSVQELVPVSERQFVVPAMGAQVTFERRGDGPAEAVAIRVDGQNLRGERVE